MKKGFTLLELLIVIGILAVLATAATLVLNPAQLLAQARDSQRIADLDAVKSAISLYLTDVTSPSIGTGTLCYINPTSATIVANCNSRHVGKTNTIGTSRVTSGSGWVPINLSAISGGSPIALLPTDPVANSATYFYSYTPTSTTALTFEIDAALESTKYTSKMTDDGGNNNSAYEIGTEPGLQM